MYSLFIWSSRIHSLKCLRFTTLDCKDIVIRKSAFVVKTRIPFLFLYLGVKSKLEELRGYKVVAVISIKLDLSLGSWMK